MTLVSLMLLTPIPWTTCIWGWPCLTVLSPSERYDQQRGHAPRTMLDRAWQAVWLVRRWLPTRELVVGGDHTSELASPASLAWRSTWASSWAIWASNASIFSSKDRRRR
jgi:hypothetical protein